MHNKLTYSPNTYDGEGTRNSRGSSISVIFTCWHNVTKQLATVAMSTGPQLNASLGLPRPLFASRLSKYRSPDNISLGTEL